MTKNIWFLCLLQGVFEFLPISSNGHLILVQNNLAIDDTILNISLHLGTLLTVIVYFFKDLMQMVKAIFCFSVGKNLNADEKIYKNLAISLIVATVPVVIVGFTIKKLGIDQSLKLIWVIGLASIVFGTLLYFADKFHGTLNPKISVRLGFMIGLAQTLALIPGASRSGTCITMARFLGMSREQSTRFTFLLSIPTVLGAVVLCFYDAIKLKIDIDYALTFYITIITFCVGLLVIHGLLRFLQKNSFLIFSVYRVIFGVVLLMWCLFH